MAPSEARHIREAKPVAGVRFDALVPSDIDDGLALCTEFGWNQTRDDWAFFIASGRAIGFREPDGRLVASAAALPFVGGEGWISMVLVNAKWQHRGLAGALMEVCIQRLRDLKAVPVLDATPAGAAVYRRLGFDPGFEIERWERAANTGKPVHPTSLQLSASREAGVADLGAIYALDLHATGLDRRALLEALLLRPGTSARLAIDGQGFVIARRGRLALHIGPVMATDAAQAIELLAAVLAERPAGERVFVDVPVRGREVIGWLERQGFTLQRGFVRMSLGAPQAPTCSQATFAVAGPEFG